MASAAFDSLFSPMYTDESFGRLSPHALDLLTTAGHIFSSGTIATTRGVMSRYQSVMRHAPEPSSLYRSYLPSGPPAAIFRIFQQNTIVPSDDDDMPGLLRCRNHLQ